MLKAKQDTAVVEKEEAKTNAVAVNGNGVVQNNVAELNAGVVEGIENLTTSNRVAMDGTDFEYKGEDRREREIIMNVSRARRVNQFWDEDGNLCQSYDGKQSTDGLVCASCEQKRNKLCKFKFEVYWFEPGNEEATEYLMTLPTVSAIGFTNYLKTLSKEGLGVHQVMTKISIERRTNPNNNNKYSVALFENAGPVEG